MKAIVCLVVVASICVGAVLAQPNPDAWNRVDRWNDMWMNQSSWGFGNESPMGSGWVEDPCYPGTWAPQCELPGGSDQQHLYMSTVWIGAIIDSGGVESPRVSVGWDGWIHDIVELFPDEDDLIVERSTRDSVNCFGEPIFDPQAIADHEYTTLALTDTMTDPFWVNEDPVDGRHRPLGVKIKRTTYSMVDEPCNHIYWIRYQIENIGENTLRDVYIAHYVDGDVGAIWEQPDWHQDDLAGFEPTHQIAYICDNDGRPYDDNSGNDFSAPHVTGTILLRPPEGIERVSFNWWISHGNVDLDYGPAWEAYADHDSLGMGWTRDYGTPMGDLHKYQLMSNGEHDFDQVRVCDDEWIIDHPQDGHAWSLSSPPSNGLDICDGYDARYLFSIGPLGRRVGDRTEFLPGDSLDFWMAYVGGLNLHNPDNPQPSNTNIDPSLFDFSDLIAHVEAACEGNCLDWAASVDRSHSLSPTVFTLDPVWPNPFNAIAQIRFSLDRMARVNLAVYDVLGRRVERLASDVFAAGSHEMSWNAEGLPSGIYFIEARTGEAGRFVQKAVLLK